MSALLASVLAVSSVPAFAGTAEAGSNQQCSQRGSKNTQINVLSCVVDDVTVKADINRVLSQNEIDLVILTIKNTRIQCSGQNNECANLILVNVENVLKSINVIVSKIAVIVGGGKGKACKPKCH